MTKYHQAVKGITSVANDCNYALNEEESENFDQRPELEGSLSTDVKENLVYTI